MSLPLGVSKQIFDISDYLDACLGRRGITGIQRVQECIVKALVDRPGDHLFVMVDSWYGRVWALDRIALAHLTSTSTRTLEATGLLAEALQDSARLLRLQTIDVLVNLGCFWGKQYRERFEEQIKTARCSFVPLIYDLIPVDHPDLCDGQTVDDFNTGLRHIIQSATAFITISQHTRLRFEAFGLASNLLIRQIYVAPLAHQLNYIADANPAVIRPDIGPANRFVLSVGTFEPRKNQLRLARAWALLAEDIFDMPVLVMAGKIGWLDPESMFQLNELSHRTGKITLIHEISDNQLATLYRDCMFTTFLSIDEGWGLPVGESLAFGKVCLASNAGAIPEAGDVFAVYVNPIDTAGIVSALRTLIVNDAYRHRLENEMRRRFRPRKWSEVVATILAVATRIQSASTNPHL